jgi:hypothetical protein
MSDSTKPYLDEQLPFPSEISPCLLARTFALPTKLEGLDGYITKVSPKPLIDGAERCARSLKREMGHMCAEHVFYDTDPGCVKLFTDKQWYQPARDTREVVIGFAAFSPIDDDDNASHVLMQAWVHPYCRRRGVLASYWPQFVADFGGFLTYGPSLSMQRFILKHGTAHQQQQPSLDRGRVVGAALEQWRQSI